MRHELFLCAGGFRLRPVNIDDAADILALRIDPDLSRFIHAVSPRVEDQQDWLASYFDREGDYYFVVEKLSDSSFQGTVGLYDVADGQAEWGRWLLKTGSLAAPASALMIYRVAFDFLTLSSVYCRTVAQNLSVVSFHDNCGLERSAKLSGKFEFEQGPVDAVEHGLSLQEFPEVERRLLTRAAQVERLMGRQATSRRT